MKFNHVGIPTAGSFDGEIPLPHLKMTVSDHLSNPFGTAVSCQIRTRGGQLAAILSLLLVNP